MEARRLAILCSHLCPINLGRSPAPLLNLSSSSCASGSKSEHLIYDSQKGGLQDDCVFCRIIRGEAPAFKFDCNNFCFNWSMEARRLAILCSHLCPINLGRSPAPLLNLSSSSCASGSKSEHLIYDSQKGGLQDDCVFCRIIRGEAPAFKFDCNNFCFNWSMEARRLAILCSHLCPINLGRSPAPLLNLSSSSCASGSKSEHLIYDSQKGGLQDDCVFCRIIRGEAPAFKLYEDESCLCILDTRPLSNGHSLIIPKSHYSSLEATPPSVIAAMCSKVPIISNAIMKSTGSDSFNLLVNNGVAAGQVIFHTHIHIIPRKARDCLWASESLERRTLKFDEEASRLAKSIQEILHSTKENDGKVQESNLTEN